MSVMRWPTGLLSPYSFSASLRDRTIDIGTGGIVGITPRLAVQERRLEHGEEIAVGASALGTESADILACWLDGPPTPYMTLRRSPILLSWKLTASR